MFGRVLVAIVVLLDDSLEKQDFLSTGLIPEQAGELWKVADGLRFFELINGVSTFVRHDDFQSFVRGLGLPEFDFPLEVSSTLPFLFAPITHLGKPMGIIHLGNKEDGQEFTTED